MKDCKGYFGEGVPVADYEGQIVTNYGTYYLRRFLETVYELTGVKPLVYCNLSTIQGDVNGFRQIADGGYCLWLAQYASNNEQYGFRETPWQKGSFAPFQRITMHQYSDHGRLSGYGGNLDLDLFYGDEGDWIFLAAQETEPVEPEPEPQPDINADLLQYLLRHLEADNEYHREAIEHNNIIIAELRARL